MNRMLVAATFITVALASSSDSQIVHGYADTTADAAECTTGRPGPDWICFNGGWLPPGMPLPGTSAAPAGQVPQSNATACTTPQPGPGWGCFGGGWLPPGMTPAPAVSAPAAWTTPTQPAASAVCLTPQPGSGWGCVGGGWLPPGMFAPATAVAPQAPAASAPGNPPNSIASVAPGGGRLRVMTWNIHFGGGNTWAQAQVIADSGADVVLLQEAQTWDEHMPSTYPQRLGQLTGQAWHAVWAGAGACASGCQGTLILSRYPIADSGSRDMSGTPVGWAAIDVGGVRVNVFNVHLEYYDTSKRSSQLQQLMDWTREFGGPRLAGGDFNSWWGEYWIQQMETEYSDTWQDVTGSDEDGYTLHGTVRFDYLFRSHDTGWRLTPQASWVHWTNVSDHGALIADYIVQ